MADDGDAEDPDFKLYVALGLLKQFWNPHNLGAETKPDGVPSWRMQQSTGLDPAVVAALERQLNATIDELEERLRKKSTLENARGALQDAKVMVYPSSNVSLRADFTNNALRALRKQASAFEGATEAPTPPPPADAVVAQRDDPCNDFSDDKRRMTEAVGHHGLLTQAMDVEVVDPRLFLQEEVEWAELKNDAMEHAKHGTYFYRGNYWTLKQLDTLAKKHRERVEAQVASESQVDGYRRARGLIDDRDMGLHNEWEEWTKQEVRKRLLRDNMDAESLEREFARRLVIVHIDVLDEIQRRASTAKSEDPAESVTYGYEMDSLVQNVAHLLKYRRCVKLAKLVYKRQGVGSLHDQYEAKLLNKELAHSHQDESNTEMGIARRIIRQAHVSNYVHYTYTSPDYVNEQKQSVRDKQRAAIVDVDKQRGLTYYPEEYPTNPPMAPIMCAAPPRMGKSHLTLLLASFAVKFGGHVEYGVAPNAAIPVAETFERVKRLQWKRQSLRCLKDPKTPQMDRPPEIGNLNVYSQDESKQIQQMNARIHTLASDVNAWVLHVRDEAQHVYKVADKMNTALADSFPIFYGLNMCVSATLLPACMEGELVGNLNSVRQLLRVKNSDHPTRSALEKYAILQPWSFPIGPDFLVPPSTRFFGNTYGNDRYPDDFDDLDDGWYKQIYDPDALVLSRPTNYYGTWLHVKEYRGVDVNDELDARHIMSESDVYIDDCLVPSRLLHAAMLDNPTFGKGAPFNLNVAYDAYLVQFNRRNRKYYDEVSGNIKADRGLRIANQPIHRLTVDAAWVMDHARAWMDEQPHDIEGTPGGKIYPMLITAPDFMQIKRLQWVSLMLKVAWLRMHEDYMNNVGRNLPPDEVRERYGVVALVYQSEKSVFSSMAAPEDVGPEVKERKVIAITFDPTLPENRFPMHAYPDLPTGTMESSIFIPTITPKHYEAHEQLFKTIQQRARLRSDGSRQLDQVDPPELFERLNALQFLLKGLPPYNALTGQDAYSQVERFPKLVHRLYRFDMEDCWMRVNNPQQMDKDELKDAYAYEDQDDQANATRPNNQTAYIIGSVFNNDTFSRDNNTEGCDNEPRRQDEMQDPYANPAGSFSGGASQQDGPQSPAAAPRIENDPDKPYAIPPCKGDDPDGTDGILPPKRRLPNMNAIALRLCISGYHNAQDAIKDAHTRCGIHKVAAAGYKMFEAGLTLQTTFAEADGTRRMFVPKYVSFALRRSARLLPGGRKENPEHEMAPNLSVLYQLLGRGFADTKQVELPTNWKLVVLSRTQVRKTVKLYGNAELLMSRFKNESIEGRKLALGSLLESITGSPYNDIKTKFLGKKETKQRASQLLLDASTLNRLLSMDVAEVGQWPFHRMRDCLTGDHRSPIGAAGLTEAEQELENAWPAFVPGTTDLQRHETPIALVTNGDGNGGGHGGLTEGLEFAPFTP